MYSYETNPTEYILADLRYLPVKDCTLARTTEVLRGNQTLGEFRIFVGKKIIEVSCDLHSDGGGWTVSIAQYRNKIGYFIVAVVRNTFK